MSEWKILPNEADSPMVNYAANFEWGAKTSWHGNTVEYIKEIYNKKTFRGCVDAGASYGFLSVPFSFMFEKVYSFEPNPGVVECLRENVAPLSNVEVYSKALSNKNQTTYLEVNAKNVTGIGSLRDEPTNSHNIIHQVETITLDSLNLVDIDFIKIDVEGHELKVLKGAIQTIEKWRPVVYCEIHSQRDINDYKRRREIFRIFEDLGYILHDVRYHDYLFLPL
jgi:FkbM family methyltransferase